MADMLIAQVENVKDRIIAAVEARADVEPDMKENLCAGAKEVYYTMLAASELLRGEAGPDVAPLVRSMLERGGTSAVRLATALTALGGGAENLAQELMAAVGASFEVIAARLPAAGG